MSDQLGWFILYLMDTVQMIERCRYRTRRLIDEDFSLATLPPGSMQAQVMPVIVDEITCIARTKYLVLVRRKRRVRGAVSEFWFSLECEIFLRVPFRSRMLMSCSAHAWLMSHDVDASYSCEIVARYHLTVTDHAALTSKIVDAHKKTFEFDWFWSHLLEMEWWSAGGPTVRPGGVLDWWSESARNIRLRYNRIAERYETVGFFRTKIRCAVRSNGVHLTRRGMKRRLQSRDHIVRHTRNANGQEGFCSTECYAQPDSDVTTSVCCEFIMVKLAHTSIFGMATHNVIVIAFDQATNMSRARENDIPTLLSARLSGHVQWY